MKKEDEGLKAVRAARKQISAEFDHDPTKLIAHLMKEQEKYRDRLLQPVDVKRRQAEGEASAPAKPSGC
jgi:hypothetical protein